MTTTRAPRFGCAIVIVKRTPTPLNTHSSSEAEIKQEIFEELKRDAEEKGLYGMRSHVPSSHRQYAQASMHNHS